MLKLSSSVEPLWVTKVALKKGIEVKPHSHEYYYHLVYITGGYYQFTIAGSPVSLGTNTVILAKPGDVIGWANIDSNDGSSFEIKFSVLDSDLSKSLSGIPEYFSANDCTRVMLQKIIDEIDKRRDNYQAFISMYLVTMLNDIIRDQSGNHQTTTEAVVNKRLSPAELVMQYIETHYSEPLSLQTIASAINFNKTYLAAAFKRETGSTVNEYLYQIRAYKACELIAYGDLSIAEVSSLTGFKSEQHFNRVFKKHIGIPPGEYRSATPKNMIHIGETPVASFDSIVFPVRSGRTYEADSVTGTYRQKED